MDTILAQLGADPLTNNAILAVVAVAVLDFLTGAVRAIADKTFSLVYLDVWVRKQLAAVVTIVLVLVFGRFVGTITVGDLSLSVLTSAGIVAAATFVAAQLKSILDNLNTSAGNPPPAV